MGNIFSYLQDKALEVGGQVYRDGGLHIGYYIAYISRHMVELEMEVEQNENKNLGQVLSHRIGNCMYPDIATLAYIFDSHLDSRYELL